MLDNGGRTRNTLAFSQSLGFCRRGEALQQGAVAAQVPLETTHLSGEVSVCGLKAFLIDERRRFDLDSGSIEVDCAKVAALDIVDSPVHVHGETMETYQILSGTGRMVLGRRIIAVGPGSIIVIPPGTVHGLCSDQPQSPLRVVMTFSPGLAPVQFQEVRDERIVAAAASAHIACIEDGDYSQ